MTDTNASTNNSHNAPAASSGDFGYVSRSGLNEQSSDAEIDAHLAQYGAALRPPQGKAPWPAGWLPGDEPVEIRCGLEDDPHPHRRLFDTHARVRFLDALASHGNVRAAAARVGVSHETAYRARRQHADFAQVWDAALVHARVRSEAELATRALDGVAVPVFLRGEHVATWQKQDARYLFAHLARLDQRIAENPGAVERAERFDHLLAVMAGNAPPDGFAAAAHTMRDPSDRLTDIPPTLREYLGYVSSEALDDLDTAACAGGDDNSNKERGEQEQQEAEAAAMNAATVAARPVWDGWNDAGAQLLDHVLGLELGQEFGQELGQVLKGKETVRPAAPDGSIAPDGAVAPDSTAAPDPVPNGEPRATDCKQPQAATAARSPAAKTRTQGSVTCVNINGEFGGGPAGAPENASAGRNMCSPLALSAGSAESYRVPDVLSAVHSERIK